MQFINNIQHKDSVSPNSDISSTHQEIITFVHLNCRYTFTLTVILKFSNTNAPYVWMSERCQPFPISGGIE